MILSKEQAKTLETLLHPDVEEAIILLCEYIELDEGSILLNPDAKMEELKVFQGKCILIQELKQYRKRLIDASNR